MHNKVAVSDGLDIYNPKLSVRIEPGYLMQYDSNLATYLINLFESKFTDVVQSTIAPGRYCLAGGALRAYYENRSARDMDIYVLEDEAYEEIQVVVKNFKTKANEYPYKINPCGEIELGSVFDDEFGLSNAKKRKNEETVVGPYRAGCYTYPYKLVNYVSMDREEVQFLHVSYVSDYVAKRSNKQLPKRKDLKPSDYITATTTDEIIEGFDFTCCQAALEFTVQKNLQSVVQITFDSLRQNPLFLTAVAKRELRVAKESNMQKCGIAYYRLHKYVTEYGYKVPTKEDFKKLERMRFYAFMDGFDPEEEHYGDVD